MRANGRQNLLRIDPQMQARRAQPAAFNMGAQNQQLMFGFALFACWMAALSALRAACHSSQRPLCGVVSNFGGGCQIIITGQILWQRPLARPAQWTALFALGR